MNSKVKVMSFFQFWVFMIICIFSVIILGFSAMDSIDDIRKYTKYDTAILTLPTGETVEVEIDAYEFEDNHIEITTTDGAEYCVSTENCILMNNEGYKGITSAEFWDNILTKTHTWAYEHNLVIIDPAYYETGDNK